MIAEDYLNFSQGPNISSNPVTLAMTELPIAIDFLC